MLASSQTQGITLTALFSSKEPRWHKASYQHRALTSSLKSWLFDNRSLTQKLISHSKNHFHIEVLKQKIERVQRSEYRALKLNHRHWAVVREVILHGNNVPWVYARTIIPLSTLRGELRRLHFLGSRPLGGTLFADPSMRREGVEIARVKMRHLPHKAKSLKPLWGRRSLFIIKNKPLLVGEVFLTDLIE
ncbi:MAG: chorismate--pyruvate lyase [Cellvibrionaceae bacterium]